MRKRIEKVIPDQTPTPRLLTVEQVAAAMGVGKDKVYALIKHEGLPTVPLGLAGSRPKLRISVTSLERWIAEHEQVFGVPNMMNQQTDVQETMRKRRARKGSSSSGEDHLPRTGTTAL